jgi:hypothetical protein
MNECGTKLSDSVTMYCKIIPQDSAYLALLPYTQVKWGGMDGQWDTRIGPSWFHTSQLTLHAMQQGLQYTQVLDNYVVTEEDE